MTNRNLKPLQFFRKNNQCSTIVVNHWLLCGIYSVNMNNTLDFILYKGDLLTRFLGQTNLNFRIKGHRGDVEKLRGS